MKYFKTFISLFILAFSLNIYGQATKPPPPPEKEIVEIKKTELKNVENLEFNIRSIISSQSRRAVSLSERDKELIAMNQADRSQFAAFLDKENTGFVRLHDAGNCDEKSLIVNAKEPCPWNILGKAASYSFRKGKYQRAYFSDIRIKKSIFEIVGVNLLGFLTNLGNVDLHNLNLQSGGVKELMTFEPTSNVEEAERFYFLAKKGFQVNNFTYKTALPIKENMTYALRSVAYDGKIYRKVNGFKFNLLENDKRGDVTVVFRVIRKHDDGSYSILWKELQRKSAPKLKTEKQVLK
jgi:hypothetical protein